MKLTYPIVMKQGEEFIIVYIPDFDINTQGKTEADAMAMARDAIGIIGVDMEDDNEELPTATPLNKIACKSDETVTLVDIDFLEYRRKNDMRAIRKNCTIPSWLSYEAEKAGINFSATLQAALKQELQLV